VLVARAMAECHMYMDLHPCERCREPDFPWNVHEAAERNGQRISIYRGTCPGCGTQRSFEFVVLDPNLPPPVLGGSEPSTIIDPGEFYEVGEWAARAMRLPPDASPGQVADAYDAALDATATIEEILKFVPPGAHAVPEEAFTSSRGRAARAADPSRFERARLEETLAERRRVLVDVSARAEAAFRDGHR
jgi:hypothetical protein